MRAEAAGLSSPSADPCPTRFTPRPEAGLRSLRSFVMRPRGCRCPLASDDEGLDIWAWVTLWEAEDVQVWDRERAQQLSSGTAVTHGPSQRPRPPGMASRTELCPVLPAQFVSCPARSPLWPEQGPRSAGLPFPCPCQRTTPVGAHGPHPPRAQSCPQPRLPSVACPEHWPSERPCLRAGQKHQGPHLTHGQGRRGQWDQDQTRPPRPTFQRAQPQPAQVG